MKNILPIVFVANIAVLLFASCTGPGGKTGPAGPAGNGTVVVNFQDNAIYSGEADTSLDSHFPYINTGSLTVINAGVIFANSEIIRSLVRFDLTSIIPSNVTVQKAYLTVYPFGGSGTTTITAYAVSGVWSETGASWVSGTASNAWILYGGDFNQSISDTQVVSATGLLPASLTFNLDASVVQGWITTPSGNNGLILKASNETTDSNYLQINSNNNGTSTKNPLLTIYYSVQ
jgi:hypothetical protein